MATDHWSWQHSYYRENIDILLFNIKLYTVNARSIPGDIGHNVVSRSIPVNTGLTVRRELWPLITDYQSLVSDRKHPATSCQLTISNYEYPVNTSHSLADKSGVVMSTEHWSQDFLLSFVPPVFICQVPFWILKRGRVKKRRRKKS